jgi:hypothetical protein
MAMADQDGVDGGQSNGVNLAGCILEKDGSGRVDHHQLQS